MFNLILTTGAGKVRWIRQSDNFFAEFRASCEHTDSECECATIHRRCLSRNRIDQLAQSNGIELTNQPNQLTNQFLKSDEAPTNSIDSRETAKTVRCSPKILIWTRTGLDNANVLLDALCTFNSYQKNSAKSPNVTLHRNKIDVILVEGTLPDH